MKKTTIKGVPIIEIYESFDGSYWFVTEKAWTQDSVIGGRVYEGDHAGTVQGQAIRRNSRGASGKER